MKRRKSSSYGWGAAAVLALLVGALYVFFNMSMPDFGMVSHASRPGAMGVADTLRVIGALIVVIAAFFYVALVEEGDVVETSGLRWLHRLAGGAVGGVACAVMVGRQADPLVLAACAVAGAALAALGVVGLVGRGL